MLGRVELFGDTVLNKFSVLCACLILLILKVHALIPTLTLVISEGMNRCHGLLMTHKMTTVGECVLNLVYLLSHSQAPQPRY